MQNVYGLQTWCCIGNLWNCPVLAATWWDTDTGTILVAFQHCNQVIKTQIEESSVQSAIPKLNPIIISNCLSLLSECSFCSSFSMAIFLSLNMGNPLSHFTQSDKWWFFGVKRPVFECVCVCACVCVYRRGAGKGIWVCWTVERSSDPAISWSTSDCECSHYGVELNCLCHWTVHGLVYGP